MSQILSQLYEHLRRKMSFSSEIPLDPGEGYVSTEDPVVIGGAGRSGTTLLSVILNAHPDVYCGEEEDLLRQQKSSLQGIAELHDVDTGQLRQLASGSTNYWQFTEQVIRVVQSRTDTDVFVTKNPSYIFDLPTFFSIFPNLRFIHMYRDGRDVAVSMRENPNHVGVRYDATYDEDGLLSPRYCAHTWRTFINASRTFQADDRTYSVAYEDLVTNPANTVRRLCAFLDIEFNPTMIREHERGLDGRSDAEREHHQRLQRSIQDDRVQNWKNELTSTQVQEFESHAGSELRHMGYSLASDRAVTE